MASPDIVRVGGVAGVFVSAPGRSGTHGSQVEYVGRRVDHAALVANTFVRVDGVKAIRNLEACYPLDESSNTTYSRAEGISVLGALRAEILNGNAVPLDEVTAKWAGVKLAATAAPTAVLTTPVDEVTQPAHRAARRSTSDAKDS